MIYWIIVNYYSTQLIQRLINSIKIQSIINHQIVIVNNSPEDRSIEQLKSKTVFLLDAPHNLGFGEGCNLGLNWVYQQDKTAIVWLINPDAYLPENITINAINCFQQYPNLSILGTLIEEPDSQIWLGGGQFNSKTGEILPQIYDKFSPEKDLIPIDWVSGCSLLINLSRFKKCPQFNPDYFLYYEDFDFCMHYRQQGHQLAITPDIKIIHNPSSITGQYPHIKLEHSIYSYLLSLEKYADSSAFWYRLIRISLVSLLSLIISPQTGLPKLKGVIRYLHQILNRSRLKKSRSVY